MSTLPPAQRTWILVVAAVVLVGAALFLGAVYRLSGGRVVLVNGARVPTGEVRVEAGGQIFLTGGVDAGATASWRLNPPHDGSFTVTGRFVNGRRIHGVALGYTTPGDPVEHHLIIQDNGAVRYQSEGRGGIDTKW